MTTDIVVGFDGSTGAGCAVDWAAHEADIQGVGLRVVTAEPWVPLSYGAAGAGAVPPKGNHHADSIVAGGRLRASKVLDDSRLESAVIPGYAPVALVRESGAAALVVVGHREHVRIREYATGSVALAVAMHSRCDVVVVPPGDTVLVGPDRPVVVWVDGSDGASLAAGRAAQIASERGAVLILAEAPVLVDTCRGAGLLVVGSRSLGGFRRLVVGSASRAAVHRANIPTLVVRG